ncbi:MAG: PIG-L family deacetylase [Bacteriovorax sp.]
MNILLIVAHPDDEIIWGGTIVKKLIENKCNITVISVTGKSSCIREKEFRMSSKELGFNHVILSNNDPGEKSALEVNIGKLIQSHIFQSECEYDFILSHSPTGEENNHLHHVQTHYEVLKVSREFEVPFVFFNDKVIKGKMVTLQKIQSKLYFLLGNSLKQLLLFFGVLELKKSPSSFLRFFFVYSLMFWRFQVFSPIKYFVVIESDLKWKKTFIKTNYESMRNPIMSLGFMDHPFEYLISNDQEILHKILRIICKSYDLI